MHYKLQHKYVTLWIWSILVIVTAENLSAEKLALNCSTPLSPGIINLDGNAELEVSFPPWDGRYLSNQNCSWVFNFPVPGTGLVELSFKSLSIEEGSQEGACDNDALSVRARENHGMSSRLLGEYCNSRRSEETHVLSYTDHWRLDLNFHSNQAIEYYGFEALLITKGCSSRPIEDETDVTISHPPGNTEDYLPNQQCFWRISLPENSTDSIIYLDWLFFDIEEGPYCSDDNISIYDGLDESSPLIGAYCNSRRPYGCRGCETLRTTGRDMFIVLRTNAEDERRGFKVFAYGGHPTLSVSQIIWIVLGTLLMIVLGYFCFIGLHKECKDGECCKKDDGVEGFNYRIEPTSPPRPSRDHLAATLGFDQTPSSYNSYNDTTARDGTGHTSGGSGSTLSASGEALTRSRTALSSSGSTLPTLADSVPGTVHTFSDAPPAYSEHHKYSTVNPQRNPSNTAEQSSGIDPSDPPPKYEAIDASYV